MSLRTDPSYFPLPDVPASNYAGRFGRERLYYGYKPRDAAIDAANTAAGEKTYSSGKYVFDPATGQYTWVPNKPGLPTYATVIYQNTEPQQAGGAGNYGGSSAPPGGGYGIPGATMVDGVSGPTTGLASVANSAAAVLGNLSSKLGPGVVSSTLRGISDTLAANVDPNFSHEGRAALGGGVDPQTGLQGQGSTSSTGLYGDAAAGTGLSTASGSGVAGGQMAGYGMSAADKAGQSTVSGVTGSERTEASPLGGGSTGMTGGKSTNTGIAGLLNAFTDPAQAAQINAAARAEAESQAQREAANMAARAQAEREAQAVAQAQAQAQAAMEAQAQREAANMAARAQAEREAQAVAQAQAQREASIPTGVTGVDPNAGEGGVGGVGAGGYSGGYDGGYGGGYDGGDPGGGGPRAKGGVVGRYAHGGIAALRRYADGGITADGNLNLHIPLDISGGRGGGGGGMFGQAQQQQRLMQSLDQNAITANPQGFADWYSQQQQQPAIYDLMRQQPQFQQQPQASQYSPFGGGMFQGSRFADGGMTDYAQGGLGTLGGYSDGGRLLRGPGDGVSDSIPATIGHKRQPARLADGEFVVPARIVSELGNGSTEAGARKLYAMLDRIQAGRKKSVGKGKVAINSRMDKHLPA